MSSDSPRRPPAEAEIPRRRVRRMLAFAGEVASGSDAAIAREYRALRRAGSSADEVAELLALLSAFCGWPAALGGLAAVAAVDPAFRPGRAPRPASRIAARRAGRRNFQAVYGPHATAILGRIALFDPSLSELLLEVPYGELYARPLLPLRVKELLACLLLVHLGRRRELRGHLMGALRCGATRRELDELLAIALPRAGAARVATSREELARAAALVRPPRARRLTARSVPGPRPRR